MCEPRLVLIDSLKTQECVYFPSGDQLSPWMKPLFPLLFLHAVSTKELLIFIINCYVNFQWTLLHSECVTGSSAQITVFALNGYFTYQYHYFIIHKNKFGDLQVLFQCNKYFDIPRYSFPQVPSREHIHYAAVFRILHSRFSCLELAFDLSCFSRSQCAILTVDMLYVLWFTYLQWENQLSATVEALKNNERFLYFSSLLSLLVWLTARCMP